MTTKKKHTNHNGSPKVGSQTSSVPSKDAKKKDKLNKNKVENKGKKVVSKHNPLAKKAKAKAKANHKKNSNKAVALDPDLDDILVDEESDDTVDQLDVADTDLPEAFDIESMSDPLTVPDDESDSIVPDSTNLRVSSLTLTPPEVSTFSTGNYTYTTHADGTQRVNITVGLQDVFRAQGYEVRISS